MFGIGFTELLMIVIIAILFLGPDKLPETMVQIAKFIRTVQRTISDAKSSLEEEMKIADLKEEAMSYKKQLNETTDELKSFKNIGVNPAKELAETLNDAKKSYDSKPPAKEESPSITTPVEPKRDTVTFEKKENTKR